MTNLQNDSGFESSFDILKNQLHLAYPFTQLFHMIHHTRKRQKITEKKWNCFVLWCVYNLYSLAQILTKKSNKNTKANKRKEKYNSDYKQEKAGAGKIDRCLMSIITQFVV